jgi:hypothetical protein
LEKLTGVEQAEQAMASRLRRAEFEAHAELLHVQQNARFNVEAMEMVARGQGITEAEAKSSAEHLEYEANVAMHSLTFNAEAAVNELRRVADEAVAEKDQYKVELHAHRLGASALHVEYVSQQQQIADYAKLTSDLKASTARQREQYDASTARLME